MTTSLKDLAKRLLPERCMLFLKRLYYPRLLRNFPEARWPGSQVVKRLVRPGDAVIDAGANIGYVTRLLAAWTGPSGRVSSFEPVPATFALLAHNVRALRLAQVDVFQLALSSRQGTATMQIPEFAGGGRNYYESKIVPASSQQGVDIATDTVDRRFAGADRAISFMKIDVEGHELDVIRGATDVLRRDAPALYIEVSGDPQDASSAAAELFRDLAHLGYAPYSVDGASVRALAADDRAPDILFLQPKHLELLS